MINYVEYCDNQKNKYKSYESTFERWKEGQKRFIELNILNNFSKKARILDVCCGDGVGLHVFKQYGFETVTGIDFEETKVESAKLIGYDVHKADFHDLSFLENNSFDLIYSSHSLEHAYDPSLVLKHFNRLLEDNGKMLIILPYPDKGPLDAHCAKEILGTTQQDEGNYVSNYICSFGFNLINKTFDNFREPEIWLRFEKKEI